MADALATLLRLRKLHTDQARRALAEALAAEAAAATAASATRATIRAELAAPPPPANHPLAGGFPAWLPAARAALANTEIRLTQAQTRSEANRAALTAARAATRAVEAVQETRAATDARKRNKP
jgi:hypothetical protein